MAGNKLRLILPVVYVSGDESATEPVNEQLDPHANESTPLDFTSLLNFQARLQQDPTFLPTIQRSFPFIEAIDLFWRLEHPVFRVTLSVDLAATYPARPPSEQDPPLILTDEDPLWATKVANAHVFYRLFNRIFYVPEGDWDRVVGRFSIALVLSDHPSSAQTVIDFLRTLYGWPNDAVRLGRQGGGGA